MPKTVTRRYQGRQVARGGPFSAQVARRAAMSAAASGVRRVLNYASSGSMRTGGRSPFVVAGQIGRMRRQGGIPVKTPGGRTTFVKRTGAINSKSKGFFKTRKYRPSKREKSAVKGIEVTNERYKSLTTTSQTLWCGHTAFAILDAYQTMWRTIVKQLSFKMGSGVKNFLELVTNYSVTAGDIFTVTYTVGDGANLTVPYTVLGTTRWEDVAGAFFNAAVFRQEGIVLRHISYVPTTNPNPTAQDSGPQRLDLEYSYITFYAKSTMKVQNRTINTLNNNDADDVDNSPLYGKIYGGGGNGMQSSSLSIGSPGPSFIANEITGYIEAPAPPDELQEPLHQLYFNYVTQKGKLHLDPGEIKTSTLTFKRNIHVNVLMKHFGATLGGSSLKNRDSLGKFRIYAIERMIDTGSTQDLQVGLEINSYINMSMYSRIPKKTQPLFYRNAL